MSDRHAINQTLLILHTNQQRRVYHAFAGLTDEVFTAAPGGGCNDIRAISGHLLGLHQFMLQILESPSAKDVPKAADTPGALQASLAEAGALLAKAITEHDPADWNAVPNEPRPGPWGDEPTLDRLARPFNDLTNHLGAIRAIRRQLGNPAEGTQ